MDCLSLLQNSITFVKNIINIILIVESDNKLVNTVKFKSIEMPLLSYICSFKWLMYKILIVFTSAKNMFPFELFFEFLIEKSNYCDFLKKWTKINLYQF